MEGDRTPEMREGRVKLSLRDPQIEKLLAGLDFDRENIDQLRRFGKNMWSARNAWSIGRGARGLFGARVIDKGTAERMLRQELAALEGGAA